MIQKRSRERGQSRRVANPSGELAHGKTVWQGGKAKQSPVGDALECLCSRNYNRYGRLMMRNNIIRTMLLAMALPIACLLAACASGSEGRLRLEEVEVSMHMVLPVESEGRYYITGTTDLANVWKGKTEGFHVYSSRNLKTWDKQLAWAPPPGSEWNSRAWGAVILPLEDKYIMLGAVYSSKRKAHGILTMEADKPGGPYKLRSEEPLMEGIDPQVVHGKDGTPWLVTGGRDAIMAAPLSDDLLHTLAEPGTILHASQVPGARAGCRRWMVPRCPGISPPSQW